ncbi:MAG: hypothetical protein ABR867_04430 [Nitrososphaerales archaeon]
MNKPAGWRTGKAGSSELKSARRLLSLKEAKARGLDELNVLTETAPNFFARFGFKSVERTSVKGNVLDSIEFREVCPDTAPMRLVLN